MIAARPDHAFTEAEYRASVKDVVDYAMEHGAAYVLRPDGSCVVAHARPAPLPHLDLDPITAFALRDAPLVTVDDALALIDILVDGHDPNDKVGHALTIIRKALGR